MVDENFVEVFGDQRNMVALYRVDYVSVRGDKSNIMYFKN